MHSALSYLPHFQVFLRLREEVGNFLDNSNLVFVGYFLTILYMSLSYNMPRTNKYFDTVKYISINWLLRIQFGHDCVQNNFQRILPILRLLIQLKVISILKEAKDDFPNDFLR